MTDSHIKTRVDAAAINVGHWKKEKTKAANDNKKGQVQAVKAAWVERGL